jgi:AcrR family transcriptional regulator
MSQSLQSPLPVRRSTRGRAKREQILLGAFAVFAEEGYGGTSMDKVATAARVSKPTLYSYFPGKEQLFVALFDWVLGRFMQAAPSLDATEPRALLERQYAWWSSREGVFLFHAALSESGRFPGLGERFGRATLLPLWERLREILAARADLGAVDVDALALVFCCGLMAMLMVGEVMHADSVVPVQSVQMIPALVDFGLGRCPVRPASGEPLNLDALAATLAPALPEPAERREQLLQEATRVFLEQGYAGTSMDRVAVAAGVSKPTLYSYFQDKEGLFSELIARVTIRRSVLPLLPVLAGSPPAVLLRKQAEALVAKYRDEEFLAFFRLVVGESRRFPELAQLYVRTVAGPGHRLMSAYLGTQNLRVPDPSLGAVLYITPTIAFMVAQSLLEGSRWLPFDHDRYIACLTGLFQP